MVGRDICRRVTCGISMHCVRDNSTWFAVAPKRTRKRGDGELHEQACIRPCEHFARCDRCSFGTSEQCERRSDCGWMLFETSGEHDNWSGEHGWCWGRRICRGYDAGLASGREQEQWLESADAVQRCGADQCLRTIVEQCAQMVRQRIPPQQEYFTGHGPGLARRAQEMLRVATETGTAVRLELIALLD